MATSSMDKGLYSAPMGIEDEMMTLSILTW